VEANSSGRRRVFMGGAMMNRNGAILFLSSEEDWMCPLLITS